MTPTHVIILAQGTQKRMGDFKRPKQLWELPAHAAAGAHNKQILQRTIGMVGRLLDPARAAGIPEGPTAQFARARFFDVHDVTLVTWTSVAQELLMPMIPGGLGWSLIPHYYTLSSPGNSSIQGLHKFLTADHGPERRGRDELDPRRWTYQRTVVLLGDVVYSWACLEKLFCAADTREVTFCGTKDLGPDRGELWGVSWYRSAESRVASALEAGLKASSRVQGEYQPGQLRHWLWAMNKGGQATPWFVAVDDYTMDVDLPEHIVKLAQASLSALADDKERGVVF